MNSEVIVVCMCVCMYLCVCVVGVCTCPCVCKGYSWCMHMYTKATYCSSDDIYLGSLTGSKLTNRLSWLAWNSQQSPCPCFLGSQAASTHLHSWPCCKPQALVVYNSVINTGLRLAWLTKPSPTTTVFFFFIQLCHTEKNPKSLPWYSYKGNRKRQLFPFVNEGTKKIKLDVKPIKCKSSEFLIKGRRVIKY